MKCRTQKVRKQIVSEYEIEPLVHLRLLNGQTKYSDAEAVLKDQYYIFECINKKNGNKEYIQCGISAAKELLSLAGKNAIDIFNPLLEGSTISALTTSGGKVTTLKIDPAAKQLYNAIMLLIVAWNSPPDTKIYEIKKQVEKYIRFPPPVWRIKQINNIIAKDWKHRTMHQIIEDLKRENTIKLYKFDLLEKELEKEGEKSFFS